MKVVRLKLDQYLDSRGITRYKVALEAKIRYETIDKYYKNVVTRYDSYILAKLCSVLDCDVSELVECVEQDNNQK